MADGRAVGSDGVPMATALYRCPLCRRSAFSGRRDHLYSAGHQRRLQAVLARFREKVEAARRTLRQALVEPYDPATHEQHFWCPCCRHESPRHLSHGALAARHAGMVAHLASPEHKKAVCAFWWENKADPNLKGQFLFSSEDYELFKTSLTKALDTYEEKRDDNIQQVAAHIRKVEQSRQEMVQAILEPQMETELCEGVAGDKTCTRTQSDFSFAVEDSEQAGPSGSAISTREQLESPCSTMLELDWQEARQSLTFIGHQETQGKGNVHTAVLHTSLLRRGELGRSKGPGQSLVPGQPLPHILDASLPLKTQNIMKASKQVKGANPPWLQEEEGDKNTGQIGPSYEEFLKEKEKQKLMKLPPNRVGANFDHNSQTAESWLPSFGRVWNHGRRWQSRHQFKAEAGQKKPKTKKRCLTAEES